MSRATLPIVGAAAGFLALGVGAAAALELPPGPNREIVSRECQACHDLDMVAATRRSRDGWNSLLDEMTSYGMRVDPQDRDKMLDYLATALAPE